MKKIILIKDFVTYDVHCTLAKQQVLDIVTRKLPDFKWRQGESDAQGPYISGMNSDDVQIKLWLGESTMSITVSFDDVWHGEPDREERKGVLIQSIDNAVVPLLGTVVKIDV